MEDNRQAHTDPTYPIQILISPNCPHEYAACHYLIRARSKVFIVCANTETVSMCCHRNIKGKTCHIYNFPFFNNGTSICFSLTLGVCSSSYSHTLSELLLKTQFTHSTRQMQMYVHTHTHTSYLCIFVCCMCRFLCLHGCWASSDRIQEEGQRQWSTE